MASTTSAATRGRMDPHARGTGAASYRPNVMTNLETTTLYSELVLAGAAWVNAFLPPELGVLPMLPVNKWSCVKKAQETYTNNQLPLPHILVFNLVDWSLTWLDTGEIVTAHYTWLSKLARRARV